MKKITLLQPPEPYVMEENAQMPHGILYLAAAIREFCKDWRVDVCILPPISAEEVVDKLEFADVFGITSTSLDWNTANNLAFLLRKKFPVSRLLAGGPHVNAFGGNVGDHQFDSIIVGEAEGEIKSVLSNFPNFSKTYRVRRIENIDDLPFPARDLLDYQGGNVFMRDTKYSEGETTSLLTSRGCPFTCAFCANPNMYTKVRFRSPQNVYDEIKHVIDTYGIKQFRISDDLMTANLKRFYELCEKIAPLDIHMRASLRVKPNSYELFKAAKDAGMEEISFGVESGDQRVLDFIDKKIDLNDVRTAFENAQKAGIKTKVLFITGLPGEKADTSEVNLKFLKTLPHDFVALKPYIPMPGSPVWVDPAKYRVDVVVKDYDRLNMWLWRANGDYEFEPLIRCWDLSDDQRKNNIMTMLNYLTEKGDAITKVVRVNEEVKS